uniref:Uncharacterized protein n=1 Tax=Bionectria ochroleuca TaxID=29856 RepID=A0A0B7JM51_BIOOC
MPLCRPITSAFVEHRGAFAGLEAHSPREICLSTNIHLGTVIVNVRLLRHAGPNSANGLPRC